MRFPMPAALALTLILVGSWAPRASGGQATPEPPPNVLVIVTDDQRTGTLEVMPETKHRFVEQGVRFPNAFATTPLCCPSRASIFTGRYAHNHGVVTNEGASGLDHASTIQRYLQDAGYLTAIVGKFLNGWDPGETPPFWDRWAIQSHPPLGSGYFGSTFGVDGSLVEIPGYSTGFVARHSEQLLAEFEDQDDDAPWFMYVAPFAPHPPSTPARRYEDAPTPPWISTPATEEEDRTDKPQYVQESTVAPELIAERRELQLRTLLSVDDLVRRIMSTLRDLGERGHTLAFYVSDNGFLWGEHGLKAKSNPYEQSVRIPFFLRWPGEVEGGAKDTRPVATVDLAPTILDAAGIPHPSSLDGRSIFEQEGRERMHLEYWRQGQAPAPTWASTWTPEWQYVEYFDDANEVTYREYYDLRSDPWQLHNLLGDADPSNDPAGIDALAAQLAADRECVGAQGPGACP
jgi:arylsulfatase A-like enzyme